jgi:hypothetical protein
MRVHTLATAALLLFASVTLGQPVEQDHVLRLSDPQQNLLEAATLIRSMAEIGELTVDAEHGSISLRGTPEQNALADWLFEHLTQPTSDAKHEYRPEPSADDVVRIIFLKRAYQVRDLQEVSVVVRTVGSIMRLFAYNPQRALAIRGTEEQIALAEWLIDKLDQPTAPQGPVLHQFLLKTSDDNILRVFYMPDTTSPARLNEMSVQIRVGTKSQRIFAYPRLRAIVMRANASQVDAAEQMVRAMSN